MTSAVGGVDVDNPYDLYDGEFPTTDKEIFFPAVRFISVGQRTRTSAHPHQDADTGPGQRQHLVSPTPSHLDEMRNCSQTWFEQQLRNNLGQSRGSHSWTAVVQAEAISFADLDDFVRGDTTSEDWN